MTTPGHIVSIANRPVRILPNWFADQIGHMTLLRNSQLKQKLMLTEGGDQPLEDIPIEGRRSAFQGKVFSGHLEEGTISPSLAERVLFSGKPHYRFEWVIKHDGFRIIAVYLAELDEDRPSIKNCIQELLSALEAID